MSERETDTRRATAPAGRTVPVRKLAVMNRLGELGVGGVAGRLERLEGDGEASVTTEQVNLGYAESATLSAFDEDERVGVRVNLSSAPRGFVVVLFPMSSANNAATMMLSEAVADLSEVDNDLAHSALVELGSMMAYGFMDAWADSFDQRIDVATPRRVHGSKRAIVDRTLRMGDDLGVYIGSRLHLPERGIDAEVLVFPDTGTFMQLLEYLGPEQVMPEL